MTPGRLFSLTAGAVAAGEGWRLFAYALVHAGGLHLGVNLFGVYTTGRLLEGVYGSRAVAKLMALAAPAGGLGFLLSVWGDPRLPAGAACVGASGVLAALLGAVCGGPVRGALRCYVCFVPVTVHRGVVLGLLAGGVALEGWLVPLQTAYGAHLGGMVLGLGFALCGGWGRARGAG